MRNLVFRFSQVGLAVTVLVAALAVIVALQAVPWHIAHAGSPVGSLTSRYPCLVSRKEIQVEYASRRERATVGVSLGYDGVPVLVINESETFKQPVELVAFEYFSACELARNLAAIPKSKRQSQLDDRKQARSLVFRADCKAVTRMNREGLLKGSLGISKIVDVFNFERAQQSYLGISFRDRAENIYSRCR